ncbi:MAG: hypothetical protein R3C53_04665 [Pirellulaceae bacterium]
MDELTQVDDRGRSDLRADRWCRRRATVRLLPRLPSGAMIVLVCAVIFLISMAFGPARGVVPRELRQHSRLNRNLVGRQHLLRGLFELLERHGAQQDGRLSSMPTVTIDELLPLRS